MPRLSQERYGGGGGGNSQEVGEEGAYTYLHCHQQNDSCVKMGSDESCCNASFLVKDEITGQCQQTTMFEAKRGPKWRIEQHCTLLLSQTDLQKVAEQWSGLVKRGVI